jgi:hypothetical protein
MSRQASNVFISHSIQHDEELVRTLMPLLNGRNITGYLAEEVRRYDVPVIEKIKDAIRDSDCLVAILSHNGKLSPSINQEIGYAVSSGISVILMIEEGIPRGEIGVFAHGWEAVPFTRERFAESCAIVIGDLSGLRVNRRVDEAREREDRRKNFRLGHIRDQTTRVRDMANMRANRIDEFINNPNAILEQWEHIRENMGFIKGTIEQTTIPSVHAHFTLIDDLMNNPALPARFNGDLWAMAHLLAQIRGINDPIDDFHDRDELIDSLQELRDRIAGLEHLLQLLEQEVPWRNPQAPDAPPR